MNKLIAAGLIGLTGVAISAAQAPAPDTWAARATRETPGTPGTSSRPAAPKAATSPKPATVAQAPAPVPAHSANDLTATAEHDLFTRYCVSCHSEKAKAAGMDSARKLTIDSIDFSDVHKHAETLELIVRKMRAGMMPPAGVRRPEPAVYKSMYTWLENELDHTAVPFAPPPGLHRFNRTEYANAIQDLLDLDIDPAKFLPGDDSTHGFDNIAGTLGISSTLVEAYVSAAGKISRLAIGEAVPPTLVVYRTPEDTSQDYHIEGLPFGTRGGMLVPHEFPSDGEYTVTVTPIFGDNMSPTGFGSVPCEKLEVLLDGERLEVLDWQGGGRFGVTPPNCGGGRRGAPPQGTSTASTASPGSPAQPAAPPVRGFNNRPATPKMMVRLKTTAGLHQVGVTFPQTNFAPVLDLDQHFQRDTLQTGPTPGFTFFPHVGTVRIEGPFNATPAKDSASRRKVFVCRPTGDPSASLGASETACARRIVTRLVTHAYRRPAATGEVDGLMAFYQDGRKQGSFDFGIENALARVLASPKFIYRIEAEPATAKIGQPYRISDIDLASRLSFFLWSRGPDDQLLTLAEQNRLHDPIVLERQVRRMLKDPRAGALAENFAGQWLNLRGLGSSGPLPMIYPDFDDPLRQAMRREVELLFDNIIREDHSIVDLLTANYTFVNERLAKHYGLPNIYGSQFRRVTLGPDMEDRWGLIGKGAFLVTTSKPERTSPVTRGKWIMGNILGMSPPNPPPDVPPLPARSADATGNAHEPTMRQRMLDHRVRADCIQCHSLMDPIGFSLENFDGVALRRTQDEGQAIDPTSKVYDGTAIEGPVGLRKWLLAYSDQFVEVAAEKLLTYALGRGVEYQDMPLVRSISHDAAKQDDRFSSLVLGVVKSKAFQMNMKTQDAPAATSSTTGGD
jgi:mono/diheme cytochrome c family protein